MIIALEIITCFSPFILTALFCNAIKNNEEYQRLEKKCGIHLIITAVISIMGYLLAAGFRNRLFPYYFCTALPMVTNVLNFIGAVSFAVFCAKLRKGEKPEGAFENLWSVPYTKRKKEKSERGSYLKKAGILALPITGSLYMLLIFGVYETFFANLNEWRFGFSHICAVSLYVFIGAAAALIFILPLFLGKRAAVKLSLLLSALFVTLYVQNAFLNVDKFVTGAIKEISGIQMALNTYFWCIILSAPLFLYKRFGNTVLKISLALSGFLLAIQLAPLPYLLSDYEEPPATTSSNKLSGEDQYVLSKNGNVIVFIMDAFYSGYFDDFIEKNPHYRDTLRDFTYYNNIATKSNNTVISLPSMFTCGELKFDRSLIDANREMWEADNAEYFYSTMHQNGYDTRLFIECDEYYGYADNMLGKIDNIKEMECESETNDLMTYLAMLKLNCYKYFPFAFKDVVYVPNSTFVNSYTKTYLINGSGERNAELNVDEWIDALDLGEELGINIYNHTYYSGLRSKGLTAEDGNKKLVFQYLFGAHPPYCGLDGKTDINREQAVEQCMTVFKEYIDQLKAMDIYDNSCVILTADHGDSTERTSDPVMLVKKPGETGETLSVNSAPGLLQSDMLPTILDCIGLDYSPMEGGTSFVSLAEDAQRERILWLLDGDAMSPKVPKCASKGYSVINKYYEYRYTGRSKDIDLKADFYSEGSLYDYWW